MILLDEPFAGVNPVMENKLIELIHDLLDQGKTFLITDHEMRLIMGLCERVLVLDYGQLIAEGPPAQIQRRRAGHRSVLRARARDGRRHGEPTGGQRPRASRRAAESTDRTKTGPPPGEGPR